MLDPRWVMILTISYALTCSALAQMIETTEKMSAEVSGHQLTYLLQVPAAKPPAEGWPLVLFLHGYGECGTDINLVKVHGPPKRWPDIKALQQCVIVSPQCPVRSWWRVAALKALVDELIDQRSDIDSNRLYITGLSMGGYGTWSFLSNYPDYFAAALPICGGGNPLRLSDNPSIDETGIVNEFLPEGLLRAKETPIWTFHGTEDQAVRIEETSRLVDRLEQASAPNIQFTSLKDVDHVRAWQIAYTDPKVWEWLFKQRKQPR
ncbi:MAG: prolyl oligopeptidase family serine peptidase [Pirellulaceae bacterium]|nr:prolyl oligopeptidase family serine peptidase [Pirellulaceae bacterium]